MKNNQKGFGIVEALVIVVALGLVGFGGWYVMSRNQTKGTDKKTTANTSSSTSKDDPKIEEQYVVPDGFRVYENTEIGFKFGYPEDWGELKTVNNEAASFALETDEMHGTDYMYGRVEIAAAKSEAFVHQAVYHGASVRPLATESGYDWLVVDPGLQEQYGPDDALDPQPEVIFQKDNLMVYEFPAGHACGVWSSLAFTTGMFFVGIKLPAICPDGDGINQEEADKLYADYSNSLVKQIAETVRVVK